MNTIRIALFATVTLIGLHSAQAAESPGTAVARAVSPAFEQDRRAILAMAGEFEVTFAFEETVALRKGYELRAATHSKATELVQLVEDTGARIVLQHVLVLGDDHEVVKHWRQDWTYESPTILEFQGDRRWELRQLSPQEVRGTWQQAVYEVDDSPRYASIGKWVHTGNVSTWTSGETWRPLPRREYTKRSDYDVLVGVNRHIITPDGWVHEQANSKLDRADQTGQPLLAREIGLNTYARISGYDFTAGREYWSRTAAFWADVRLAWNDALSGRSAVRIAPNAPAERLARQMLDLAVAPENSGSAQKARALISDAVVSAR